MLIHVRRRHIVKGKRRRSGDCPIALAFEEVCGDRPRVHHAVLYTHDAWFALPRIARRFIARFDAGRPVKPFAFVLK